MASKVGGMTAIHKRAQHGQSIGLDAFVEHLARTRSSNLPRPASTLTRSPAS